MGPDATTTPQRRAADRRVDGGTPLGQASAAPPRSAPKGSGATGDATGEPLGRVGRDRPVDRAIRIGRSPSDRYDGDHANDDDSKRGGDDEQDGVEAGPG